MPDAYRVNLTLSVARHLTEIFEYIEQDSPPNARRMIRNLLSAIDSLDTFPHRHRILDESREFGEEVRSMPVSPYLVRYHVNDSARVVTILSVRHGARLG